MTTSVRLTLIWALLLAMTVASVGISRTLSGAALLLPALGLAVLKGQLVVDHFMGLRRVRRRWRLLMGAYLLGLGALIGAAFLTV